MSQAAHVRLAGQSVQYASVGSLRLHRWRRLVRMPGTPGNEQPERRQAQNETEPAARHPAVPFMAECHTGNPGHIKVKERATTRRRKSDEESGVFTPLSHQ